MEQKSNPHVRKRKQPFAIEQLFAPINAGSGPLLDTISRPHDA